MRSSACGGRTAIGSAALGCPLHPNSLASRFRRLIAAARVPKIRFHDLRHSSATLMLANGERPKIVEERLGHSNVSMTLNRYSHVTQSMQRDAADTLNAAFDVAITRQTSSPEPRPVVFKPVFVFRLVAPGKGL